MNRIHPPQWLQNLLRLGADQDTMEEIEGDLLEFYQQWVTDRGRFRANFKYMVTVVTLFRPWKRKKKSGFNPEFMVMLRSYLVMSWRMIVKNRLSSLINFAGLTLGLTTALLILLVVLREFEYDQHHAKKEVLFAILKNQKTNDGISTGRATPGPLAKTLKTDYAHVVHAARVAYFDGTRIIVNGKKSTESGAYVDAELMQMMSVQSIKGDAFAALDKNMLVVSKTCAARLFGAKEPVGQRIEVGPNSFFVGAVIEDITAASTLRFSMAVPFQTFEKNNEWLKKWDDNRIQTWIELDDKNHLPEFNKAIAGLVTKNTKDPNESLFAYPLVDLHLHGNFVNGHASGGMIVAVWILVGFGVFMLLIACVNFMNIATAQSTTRAREVGVRKVLGAMRKGIIFQFLNEAFMITLFALVAAVVVTIIIIPSFNSMMHTAISPDFGKMTVWMILLAVTLTTALVAGSYPAFVLGRFTPARVLKGIVDHPGGLSLRRVLVTFQFVISISVLVGVIILYAQFEHVRARPMGYDRDNLVNISLDSMAAAKFDILKTEVLKIQGVKSVTATGGNILYSGGAVTGMDWPGKKNGEDLSIAITDVDYDWANTLGIDITSGRDFSDQFASDVHACLMNQIAVDKMRLEHPVGSVVGGHTVIGVFKDYVYNNPSGSIGPMIVYLAPKNVHHLYVRMDANASWAVVGESVKAAMKIVSPENEFEFHFTSDEYQSRFEELSDLGLMVSVFGGMTIFISCLGLFGLSGFIAERRNKEMSIRKVFGANRRSVFWALSRDILKPVLFALLIVIPWSAWVSGFALDKFAYRVSLTWWMFAQATLIVICIAVSVVYYHGWRAAIENPAKRLRSE